MTKKLKIFISLVSAILGIWLAILSPSSFKKEKAVLKPENQGNLANHTNTPLIEELSPHDLASKNLSDTSDLEIRQAEKVKLALARFKEATANMNASDIQSELTAIKAKSEEWQNQITPDPIIEDVVDASNQKWKKLTYNDGQIIRYEISE